ncbi:hypothetical protein OHA01_26460 [Micromonospora zamorensis]|uniref:hypothetical protein n=1 Tax=Micromonospora zamorensis TaxID=709883 RepID=UPI00352A7B1D|nr:hypothetical protein OG423_14015 [Micromonospora zamorensis]WTE86066.1 hypothetical protein OHA01_26460 [Micromonospora zamorensis]
MGEHVSVRIVIEIGDEKKEFHTIAATSGDQNEVADGLITGLHESAAEWLRDRRRAARGF